jgi:hypothetical protein
VCFVSFLCSVCALCVLCAFSVRALCMLCACSVRALCMLCACSVRALYVLCAVRVSGKTRGVPPHPRYQSRHLFNVGEFRGSTVFSLIGRVSQQISTQRCAMCATYLLPGAEPRNVTEQRAVNTKVVGGNSKDCYASRRGRGQCSDAHARTHAKPHTQAGTAANRHFTLQPTAFCS